MKVKILPCLLSLTGGLLLVIGVLWLSNTAKAHSLATIRYVALPPAGNDSGNSCLSPASPCATIQHAIDVAATGDILHIAGGTYARSGTLAEITRGVTLVGGFDPNFTATHPDLYPTVLDAGSAGTVISVTSSSDVMLLSLTVTGGDGTGNCGYGCGGGIFVQNTKMDIMGCIIEENTGSHNSSGHGGGVYALNSDLKIWDSQVLSNTANAYTENYPGRGGGIYAYQGQISIRRSTIQGNIGHVAYSGSGGGIYLSSLAMAEVLSNTISDNQSSLGEWRSDGGGLWIDHTTAALVAYNLIENNATSGHPTQGAGFGGGVYIWDSKTDLTSNVITGNSAGTWQAAMRPGGGIAIQSTVPVTVSNNLITHNTGSPYEGGGVSIGLSWAPGSMARLFNNTIADNGHNGVSAWQYASISVFNNLISGHQVGLYTSTPITGAIIIDTNLFWNTDDPILGGHAIRQDPRLRPDYHLGFGSPALNAGLTIPWLTVDLDGEPRPQGSGYDIGAYEGEESALFLPLILK